MEAIGRRIVVGGILLGEKQDLLNFLRSL